MQTSTTEPSTTEEQLETLRIRLKEIRYAKKWLTEYRINAPVAVSRSLAAYYHWLCTQELNTVAMGKRLKTGQ